MPLLENGLLLEYFFLLSNDITVPAKKNLQQGAYYFTIVENIKEKVHNFLPQPNVYCFFVSSLSFFVMFFNLND